MPTISELGPIFFHDRIKNLEPLEGPPGTLQLNTFFDQLPLFQGGIIALTGIPGSGKSYWARVIGSYLRARHDDFLSRVRENKIHPGKHQVNEEDANHYQRFIKLHTAINSNNRSIHRIPEPVQYLFWEQNQNTVAAEIYNRSSKPLQKNLASHSSDKYIQDNKTFHSLGLEGLERYIWLILEAPNRLLRGNIALPQIFAEFPDRCALIDFHATKEVNQLAIEERTEIDKQDAKTMQDILTIKEKLFGKKLLGSRTELEESLHGLKSHQYWHHLHQTYLQIFIRRMRGYPNFPDYSDIEPNQQYLLGEIDSLVTLAFTTQSEEAIQEIRKETWTPQRIVNNAPDPLSEEARIYRTEIFQKLMGYPYMMAQALPTDRIIAVKNQYDPEPVYYLDEISGKRNFITNLANEDSNFSCIRERIIS